MGYPKQPPKTPKDLQGIRRTGPGAGKQVSPGRNPDMGKKRKPAVADPWFEKANKKP